jgi:hypothetical protein
LIRDNAYVPILLFALLNVLKLNLKLNRIQSAKVLSALLFNNPHIDLLTDQLITIDRHDGNEQYV